MVVIVVNYTPNIYLGNSLKFIVKKHYRKTIMLLLTYKGNQSLISLIVLYPFAIELFSFKYSSPFIVTSAFS